MTEMIELVHKDNKTVLITVFCTFKKLKNTENMLKRHEICKKEPNQTSRRTNYNGWGRWKFLGMMDR